MRTVYACAPYFFLAKMKIASATGGADLPCPEKKAKRQISMNTFEKWQRQFSREHETLSWLWCMKDKQNRSLIKFLWCEVCRKYKSRIWSLENFSKVNVYYNSVLWLFVASYSQLDVFLLFF